jgi:hypothetical protein
MSSGTVAVILVRFEYTRIFSTNFRKIFQTLNSMKIRPVGAKSFHADKWTDRWKDGQDAANSRFLQFSEDSYYQYLILNFFIRARNIAFLKRHLCYGSKVSFSSGSNVTAVNTRPSIATCNNK